MFGNQDLVIKEGQTPMTSRSFIVMLACRAGQIQPDRSMSRITGPVAMQTYMQHCQWR